MCAGAIKNRAISTDTSYIETCIEARLYIPLHLQIDALAIGTFISLFKLHS